MRVIDLLIYGVIDFIIFYLLLYRPLQKRKQRIAQSCADLNKKNHELMEINNQRIITENGLVDFSIADSVHIVGDRMLRFGDEEKKIEYRSWINLRAVEPDVKIQKDFKADTFSGLLYQMSQYIIKMGNYIPIQPD